jgi:hypothetical protein
LINLIQSKSGKFVKKSLLRKIKKYIIEDETNYNYDLVGICSHQNDYRLIWAMNELFDVQLEKPHDLFEICSAKGDLLSFPYYIFRDRENFINIFFIKNKNEGSFLIPEKKQIDYFVFLINNHLYDITHFISKLKSISAILAAYQFTPTEFNSTEHILFDE